MSNINHPDALNVEEAVLRAFSGDLALEGVIKGLEAHTVTLIRHCRRHIPEKKFKPWRAGSLCQFSRPFSKSLFRNVKGHAIF